MTNLSFVVAVISPRGAVIDLVSSAMEEKPEVGAVWALNEYPAPGQLTQIRDAPGGCVVFLDFEDASSASAIASELDRSCPEPLVLLLRAGDLSQHRLLAAFRFIMAKLLGHSVLERCRFTRVDEAMDRFIEAGG